MGAYRPSVSFTDKANKEKAWCKVHPRSYIGQDKQGNWFKMCVWGNKEQLAGHIPGCEIVVEGGEKE